MSYHFAAVIEQWLTSFDISDVRDILLEFLALIAFLFLLIVLLVAFSKAPMLIKHGSIEMFSFVILGFIHASMNLFDEFAWFTQEFYNFWKMTKDITLLVGAIVLVIGFFRFFAFSARLFGVEPEEEEVEEPAKEIETTSQTSEF